MKKLSAYLRLSSKAMWREGFQTLLSRLYWRGRSLKARIHSWYIQKIWMPRHQEPEFTGAERQEAAELIDEILTELKMEEIQHAGK